MQKQNSLIQRFLPIGVGTLFILLPFHALLTAWFASHFGHFDFIRLWKEIILCVLSLISVAIVLKHKTLRAEIRNDKLFWLVSGFLVWLAFMTIMGLGRHHVNTQAAGYGFIIDARFFVFMLITLIAARAGLADRKWSGYVLFPAAVVILFGLLQPLLPNDFLRHFGYGAGTLQTFQAVDNKPELARLQSTLRGPNPLGAYLVIIITLLFAGAVQFRKKIQLYGLGIVAAVVVLFGTYSRSAWIGVVIAGLVFVAFLAQEKRQKRLLYLIAAASVAVLASGVFLLRHNDYVQDIVFHTNERSGSAQSSNERRSAALHEGIKDLYRQPFGAGVGSAGPASLRNDKAPARLAENFFIQIGQETGIIGLMLFIGILLVTTRRLRRIGSIQAYAALAALGGLVFINLVSHGWADDTVAYVFFGIIGLTLGTRISTKSENLRYTKT